ncbi:hypothetical protein Patl1_31408 [Pistacia atlantica]|uniref:Uncharacterized protein n=1 Tax=Pistacia atlantica TaxID=434234 RepID=A0ACC1ANP9_9ROSI|nr:hypothetical protein Patl1_31408 [Pistacia atlantica]
MIQSHPVEDLYLDDKFVNNGVAMDDDLMILNFFESSPTFSPPFTTTHDQFSLETSSTNFAPSAMSNEFIDFDDFPFHVNESSSVLGLEDLDPNFNIELDEMRDWLENGDHRESDDSYYHQLSIYQEVTDTSMDVTSIIQPILNLPTQDMEINNELCTSHLAKAYGEAMANEQRELAEVIVRRINEKVSPVECSRNGMFAHFTANSAILEAIPHDAGVLHIVDFDMGEGIQWASMIVALAQQQKLLQQCGIISQQITLKLTSIKWKNGDCICGQAHPHLRFEETKKQLICYANCHELKLKVEEMELQDLVSGIKKTTRRGRRREWLAFNCMWALPHMRRRRRRRHVMEFLKAAKDFLPNSDSNKTTNDKNNGIITFGDGDTWEKIEDYSCFGSFFDSYQNITGALLESMEWNFHKRLAEARIAMECLFVAPFASCVALLEKWKEGKRGLRI